MPNYTLHYFNGRGRAEVCRMLFGVAGVKYNDKRIEFSEWDRCKNDFPCNRLPCLEMDSSHKMPQTMAICRYLAREFNFFPKVPMDMLRCDYICDCFFEILDDYMKYFHSKNGRFRMDGGMGSHMGSGMVGSGMGSNMSSGMVGSNMNSGMVGSGMSSGMSSNMSSGMMGSNMNSGMMGSNMGSGMVGSGMSSGMGSNMSSGMMGSNMGSGMVGSGMSSGMGSNMNSGMMGSNMSSGMMGSNMGSGMMGSGMSSGMGSNMNSGMMGSNMSSGMMGSGMGGGDINKSSYDNYMQSRFLNTFNRIMPFMERTLSMRDGGSKFFMGHDLMWSDMMMYCVMETMHTEIQSMFSQYPKLMSLYQRVAQHPKVSSYLKSRRVTNW